MNRFLKPFLAALAKLDLKTLTADGRGFLALLVALPVTAASIHALMIEQDREAGSCRCEVTKRFERAYDELLNLSSRERRTSELEHLPWGIPVNGPSSANEHLLHQEHYIINHDTDLLVPTWVAYHLTDDDLETRRDRTECFRSDARLDLDKTGTCFDYSGSGFDRGHLVPNADMTRSEAAMINTYMFTNMVPQNPDFNRNIWAHLEGMVREWAQEYSEVYVITGAVFDRDGDGLRDSDSAAPRTKPGTDVAVPTHFYKIIAFEISEDEIEVMCFLLDQSIASPPATDRDDFLTSAMTTIGTIESLTDVDFFPLFDAVPGAAIVEFDEMWPVR